MGRLAFRRSRIMGLVFLVGRRAEAFGLRSDRASSTQRLRRYLLRPVVSQTSIVGEEGPAACSIKSMVVSRKRPAPGTKVKSGHDVVGGEA